MRDGEWLIRIDEGKRLFSEFHVAGMFASSGSSNRGAEKVTLTPNKKDNLDYKSLGEYFSPVVI